MNCALISVQHLITELFKDEFESFGLQDNRELASFLHYNTYNEYLSGYDRVDANFKNFYTGRKSKLYSDDDGIWFFPVKEVASLALATYKYKGNIKQDENLNVFRLNSEIRSIKVNENSLIIEFFDLKGEVVTQYYDAAALAILSESSLNARDVVRDIKCIEKKFAFLGYSGVQPDRTIVAKKKDRNFTVSVIENNETVINVQIPYDKSRTLYSVYYEFMKSNNYFEDNSQQVKTMQIRR